ncbi:MAG: heme-copper oxidase subunit III [Verrucomicrobia bacterium]|nr:MAG: heme-copper oxidase subunit III [Verrucomicrobiota bacterium]
MDIPYTSKPRPDTGLYNAKVGIWLFLASEVMLFGALFSSYILLRVGALEENWPHGLLNIPIGTFNTAVLIISSVTVVMAWASLKMKQFGRFKIFQAITVLCALAFLGIKSFEYKDKFTHYEVWKTDGTRMTGHIEGNPMFLTKAKLVAAGKDKIEFLADPHHYSEGKLKIGAQSGEHKHVEIAIGDIKRLSAFVPAHSTYFAIYFTLTALHALHVLGGAIVIGFLFGPGSKMWHTDPDRFTNRVEVAGLFWHFVDLVWIFLFPVLYLL